MQKPCLRCAKLSNRNGLAQNWGHWNRNWLEGGEYRPAFVWPENVKQSAHKYEGSQA